jgi:beta-phosphoglucomutase
VSVIFDFDGVIADTEILHFEASTRVLTARGIPLDHATYYARYLGFNDEAMLTKLAEDQGRELSRGDVASFIREKGEIIAKMYAAGDLVYPAAPACFERLGAAFPLAIASGAFREEIEHILRAWGNGRGLHHHFKTIVGAGDVAHSKPHPAPYLEAARRIGADPSECVAIEDSMWGLDSARAAGMRTIAVTNTYPAGQLTADLVVSSLDEITPETISALLQS